MLFDWFWFQAPLLFCCSVYIRMLYKKIAFNFPRDISFFVIFQETFVHLLPNMVWCTLWLQKLHHTSRPVVPKTTAGMALIFKVVGHWFQWWIFLFSLWWWWWNARNHCMWWYFSFFSKTDVGLEWEVRTRKCVDTFFVQVCVNLISLFLGHSFLLSHVVVRRNF